MTAETSDLSEFPGFEYFIQEGQGMDYELMNPWQMVTQFHKAMGQPVDDLAKAAEAQELRSSLIWEERKELLKEIVDLAYVLIGEDVEWGDRENLPAVDNLRLICRTLGMDFDGAFAEVHMSNMSKLGDDGKPIYREDGKVLKSSNYVPADMTPYI